MPIARFRSRIPVSVEDLFAWHERPGAFERLTPPWQRVDIVKRTGTIHPGDVLEMDFRGGPVTKRWIALHSDYVPNSQFRDTQVAGPFQTWVHTHRMHDDGPGQSVLDDEVRFELPFANTAHALFGGIAHHELKRLFRYRHARTRLDLWRHAQYAGSESMNVAVLGNHPLASQVRAFLGGSGHEIVSVDHARVIVDLGELDRFGSGNLTTIRIERNANQGSKATTGHARVQLALPVEVVGASFGGGSPLLIARETLTRVRRADDRNSWISEDDLIGLVYHAILTDAPPGTITATARSTGSLPGFTLSLRTRSIAGAFITGRL